MMSMKCKYALKALTRLARDSAQGLLHTADIARLENIPKKFLEQILLDLKHARIVKSKQGIGGGYYLVKKPKDISVADIYRLFDGAISLVSCVSLNFYEKCDDCKNERDCLLRNEFIRIREGARLVMSKITIESFLPPPPPKKKQKSKHKKYFLLKSTKLIEFIYICV
jgi:Rrf2 family protein